MAIESKTVIGQCGGFQNSPRSVATITLHFDMSGTSVVSDSSDPSNPDDNYTVTASGSTDVTWTRTPFTQRIGEFQSPGDNAFFMFIGCCCACRSAYVFDEQNVNIGLGGGDPLPVDAPSTSGWAQPNCDVTISGYPSGTGDGTFTKGLGFVLWDTLATPCRSADGSPGRLDLYTLNLRVGAKWANIIGPNAAVIDVEGSNDPSFLTDGTGYLAFATPNPCLNSQSYSVTVTTSNNVTMGTQSWDENFSATFTLSISS